MKIISIISVCAVTIEATKSHPLAAIRNRREAYSSKNLSCWTCKNAKTWEECQNTGKDVLCWEGDYVSKRPYIGKSIEAQIF